MQQPALVEDIQNYAQNIVDTVREPLLILDTTLRVRSANRAFYQTFHVSPGGDRGPPDLRAGQRPVGHPRPADAARGHRPQELRLRRLRARAHLPGHRPPGDAA